MRFILLLQIALAILVFSFLACSEENTSAQEIVEKNPIKEVNQDSIRKQDSIDAEIERIKNSLITNLNAKEKLTEYGEANPETKVLMKTSMGNMKIRLYNETPLHRANFIMLAKKNYFDSTLFYRIIDKFMVQGGNSDDEEITTKMAAIGAYRIPNEINPNLAHTKGAIAMAVSPEEQQFEKKSSAFNFYIVEGQRLNERYLKEIEGRGITITPSNRKKYLQSGGAPHLDGNYTVFGEVYEGFNTLSRLSKVKTDESDWPVKPVYILSVEVIK